MVTETTQKSLVINLVSFRKEYFPISERDRVLLLENNVSVSRITEPALLIIQKTLLKKMKIRIHPWVEVYESLLEEFKKSLGTSPCEFIAEENWLLIKVGGRNVLETQVVVDRRTKLLQTYFARYGFKVGVQIKERPDYILNRLVFTPDRGLVPSIYYNTTESIDTPIDLKLRLSPSCRLVLTKKLSHTGIPAFKVVFEDKFGQQWSEAFSRAFNFSEIKAEDCEAALNFFATMLSYVKP